MNSFLNPHNGTSLTGVIDITAHSISLFQENEEPQNIKDTFLNKNTINIAEPYDVQIDENGNDFKCFKLDVSKEVMPYGVYTYENVTMGACTIQSALDILKEDDKKQFLDNLDKWDCVLGKGMDNQMFDLIKYSSIYCKMDCKVLMDGYEVFRGWMLEHTGLDVDRYIIIQSLASSFMLTSGCYEHVFQISGVLQQFISSCVVGGWSYD